MHKLGRNSEPPRRPQTARADRPFAFSVKSRTVTTVPSWRVARGLAPGVCSGGRLGGVVSPVRVTGAFAMIAATA